MVPQRLWWFAGTTDRAFQWFRILVSLSYAFAAIGLVCLSAALWFLQGPLIEGLPVAVSLINACIFGLVGSALGLIAMTGSGRQLQPSHRAASRAAGGVAVATSIIVAIAAVVGPALLATLAAWPIDGLSAR